MDIEQALQMSQAILGEGGFNYDRANQDDILFDQLNELSAVGTITADEAQFVLNIWRGGEIATVQPVRNRWDDMGNYFRE